MSSADTTPITPARFAAALKDLSVPMLHLKVLEIRNALAHLQYSNDQLEPFAQATDPDQDCIDAIQENKGVMERMVERIALVRLEAEERGVSWADFENKEDTEAAAAKGKEEEDEVVVTGVRRTTMTNGGEASPWTDGTFQTGTIRNGEVRLDAQPGVRERNREEDERLRGALEERLREMGMENNGEEDDGGMHL